MKQILISLSLLLAVSACAPGWNPITGGDTSQTNIELPPGTDNPTQNSDIERYEAQDGSGSGYAQSISYDPGTDTFTVDNLAFDGDNTYARDDVVPSLGPFKVYENDSFYTDSVTGTPIGQFEHKAVVGVSTTGNTSFAIVRTGSYLDYGFGGFLYQRTGGVDIPTTGQAVYTGKYGGLRDFQNRAALEYVTGDLTMAIDFDDFDQGYAVTGSVTNRRVLDTNGNDITQDIVDALQIGGTDLPVLVFEVGPGTMNTDGEMAGGVGSTVVKNGGVQVFETGTYYAVLSGAGADQEIVGVVVVTSADPRLNGVTVRETGGFILYR